MIDINVAKSGLQLTEKFQSLEPIQKLVEQVTVDRQSQQQNQKLQQQGKNQLNAKLNDIANNWSVEEQSALDIAGILQNVAQASNNSPFASKSSNISNNNQNTHYQGHPQQSQLGHPPAETLVQISDIQWQYLDPNGFQQGPFTGLEMQSWYVNGYLKDNLQLHRVGESGFYTLFELKTLLNSVDPFSIALPPVGQPLQTQQIPKPAPLARSVSSSFQFQNHAAAASSNHQLSNLFDLNSVGGSNDNFHQSSPRPILDHSNSFSQQSNFFGAVSSSHLDRPASPWLSQQNSAINGSNAGSSSPFLSGIINLNDKNSGVDLTGGNLRANGVTAAGSLNNSASVDDAEFDQDHDELFNQIHSVVLGDVLGREDQNTVEEAASQIHVQYQKQESNETVPEVQKASREQAAPENSRQQQRQQQHQQQQQQQTRQNKVTPSTANKPVASAKPKVKSQVTPIAPWANTTQAATSTNNINKPQLTMSQIHELEKAEVAKQQKLKEEQIKKTSLARLAREAEAEAIREKRASNVDIPLNWVSNNNSNGSSTGAKKETPVVKSIFEIQKEEEQQAAKLQAAKEAQDMAAAIAIVEAAERKNRANDAGSFAASSSIVDNGNAWTTVVSKKQHVKPANAAKPKITTTPSSRTTPDLLRKVSAPPLASPAITSSSAALSSSSTPASSVNKKQLSGVSKITSRYEFLDWCKTTLRLNKNVNVDEVLSILLILPTGSNESKEIIADTIYCNSSTMDGRRFANDFMKRRELVESVVAGDGLQWDDVLVSFNRSDGVVTEDDGDFQVVKKGKRRN